MRNFLLALLLLGFTLGAVSCANVLDDIAGPSEPTDTDELAPRVEPKSFYDKYNPEIEEEIESDEAPLETQEMEDQPLIK